VKLRWHGDNHVIEVGVEVSTFWNIKTEWWRVVITSKQVVGVVGKTRLVGGGFGEFWRPYTLVSVFSLMNGHVWWPDSIMDLSLTEVPLLEVVTSVLLVSWVDFWQVDHLTA
jgi:hypothetical protein